MERLRELEALGLSQGVILMQGTSPSVFCLEYGAALMKSMESSFSGLGYKNMPETFLMDKASQEYAQDLSFVGNSAVCLRRVPTTASGDLSLFIIAPREDKNHDLFCHSPHRTGH